MGYEYKIGGFWLVSVSEVAPDKLRNLARAKSLAKTTVQNALSAVSTVHTILQNAKQPNVTAQDLMVLMHPDFKQYLCVHFRIKKADRCVGGIPSLTTDYLELVDGQPESMSLGPLAKLDHAQAISDAYVLTDFIVNMPVINHTGFAKSQLVIGLGSNQRVFDSIGNDAL